ncbi:hypothetical protein QL285_066675 [Trifolium repens]|nr:hypothetical protein QL285_066675 [Trifolium repens]
MDLDVMLRIDFPSPLMELGRWERSNCICLMIIRNAILEIFLVKLSEKINTVTYFIKEIEKWFLKKEKCDIPTLLGNLNSIKYKDKLQIQCLKMNNNNINNLNEVTIVVSFVELKSKEALL